MWYVRGVLYAVLYVRVSYFVVRGCAVLMRYIDVCNCDVFIVLLMCTLTIGSYVLCVFRVEGMSVVVNVMLSLIIVMSPTPALCNLSLRTVAK